jgi:PPOX class probable FMN-dependent enzyme
MLLAPWRSPLQRALHRNRSQPHSRYLQLATVTPKAEPANRSVVFRGFLANTNSIQIVTDTRSQKFIHLQHQPWAEICWYFTKSREQFRLLGKVTLVTAEHLALELIKARQNCWYNLSNAAKKQFFWATPGELIQDNPYHLEINLEKIEPPANFCLLLLNPEKVDHLELKGEQQNRHLYLLNYDQTWTIKQVNP